MQAVSGISEHVHQVLSITRSTDRSTVQPHDIMGLHAHANYILGELANSMSMLRTLQDKLVVLKAG